MTAIADLARRVEAIEALQDVEAATRELDILRRQFLDVSFENVLKDD